MTLHVGYADLEDVLKFLVKRTDGALQYEKSAMPDPHEWPPAIVSVDMVDVPLEAAVQALVGQNTRYVEAIRTDTGWLIRSCPKRRLWPAAARYLKSCGFSDDIEPAPDLAMERQAGTWRLPVLENSDGDKRVVWVEFDSEDRPVGASLAPR